MELSIAVLCWTLSVSVAMTTLLVGGYLSAATDLARAKARSEARWGSGS